MPSVQSIQQSINGYLIPLSMTSMPSPQYRHVWRPDGLRASVCRGAGLFNAVDEGLLHLAPVGAHGVFRAEGDACDHGLDEKPASQIMGIKAEH